MTQITAIYSLWESPRLPCCSLMLLVCASTGQTEASGKAGASSFGLRNLEAQREDAWAFTLLFIFCLFPDIMVIIQNHSVTVFIAMPNKERWLIQYLAFLCRSESKMCKSKSYITFAPLHIDTSQTLAENKKWGKQGREEQKCSRNIVLQSSLGWTELLQIMTGCRPAS